MNSTHYSQTISTPDVVLARKEMFKPVVEAGLKPGEVADLLNVCRVTASRWLNYHSVPHHLIQDRVDKFLETVKAALAAGDLPLSNDIRPRERLSYLRKVFASHTTA